MHNYDNNRNNRIHNIKYKQTFIEVINWPLIVNYGTDYYYNDISTFWKHTGQQI